MDKLTNLNNLDKISKALDRRCKELIDGEKARAIAEEQVLQSEIDITKDMFGGRSIKYIAQAEYDILSEEEKNSSDITYFITDAVDLSHDHENKEFLDGLNQEMLDNFASKDDLEYSTILDWEADIVVDTKYKYGDIRRYGAKCDGVTDDSDVLQLALDNCCPNNMSVYIPENRTTLIAKSIVLKDHDNNMLNWHYRIESKQTMTDSLYIYQKCKNLFVGEKFYNDIPEFTEVKIYLQNVVIRCADNDNVKRTVFKAIKLYSSVITDCKFYFPYVLIEGAIAVGTKFDRNRIQGFKYAVLSSTSIINDEHDWEYINEIFRASNYNIEVLEGLLVQSNPSATDYTKFSIQSNDGYFNHNYMAGKCDRQQIPRAIFLVENIDSDFIIQNNWFEFCKFAISSIIRVKGHTESSIQGCDFTGNVFQYFFRFFDPRSRYTLFKLSDNQFYSFSRNRLISQFTYALDDVDITTCKCGVIVGDYTEENKPYITSLKLINNRFINNDYSIYFDNGDNFTSFRFSCKESGSTFTNNTNEPYVRLRNIESIYKYNNFQCLDNIELTDNNITGNSSNTNTFLGQRVFIDGKIYISVWDANINKPKLLLLNDSDALTLNGYSIWVGTTEELEAITERDPNTIYFEIDDVAGEEVVQVDIVDNVLQLTADKYQKTSILDGTTIAFPSVNKFTEIHLYFTADSNMNISLPDNCKWRVEPNIEEGKSYEIIATYNTIEWLVNVIVYS